MAVFPVTVGVVALQGAFVEHIALLRRAVDASPSLAARPFTFLQVRNADELARCDALIVPGGESTTLALVAARSGLLEPLRTFVRVEKKPTWGTCAGLILLAEQVDAAKEGGQALIGGLDVRVRRNHFGRQINSFERDVDMPFLAAGSDASNPDNSGIVPSGPSPTPFRAVFIRAPVVSEVLEHGASNEAGSVVDGQSPGVGAPPVQVLSRLDGTGSTGGNIVAVRQGNIFGTSFHPELTDDVRVHAWWLQQAVQSIDRSRLAAA
ncbi:glutamine amidotransferase subunit pdxt [Niveomyces insectorum RCEF 264]|uniref:glutaminase n=1 Tax=Niveomyces insectorum RCEF 264 TaxID=1081102 RepID=A0A167Z0K7_9HYPO|nr:glutamine amidotransferase subunit pdxt [Niveomyces insectorum RCEF 264]